ncbi:hypothetical protein [Marinobacter salicampi]|uniref:hypothetical protein n=1 Tax=Marinobacter salicampi TaxID=435907 RepID=UPI00140D057E|nr:hypothetical protein [Marinobacter salicampi]
MALMFFVELKADPTLNGNVRQKLADAFDCVVRMRDFRVPVLDFRVDELTNEDQQSEYCLQIYYDSKEPRVEVDDYLEVSVLFDLMLKGPANPHGVILDFNVVASADAPAPKPGFKRGDAAFDTHEQLITLKRDLRSELTI